MTITEQRASSSPRPFPESNQPIANQPQRSTNRARLASRIAWREVCRRPGRTVLVGLLIAVPTMAMLLASTAWRTGGVVDGYDPYQALPASLVAPYSLSTPEGVSAPGYKGYRGTLDDPLALDDVLNALPPESSSTFVRSFYNPIQTADGRSDYATFTTIDVSDPLFEKRFVIEEGRAPAAGEIALDPRLAAGMGVSVGDELRLEVPSGTWTVSGLAWDRYDIWERYVLMPDMDIDRLREDKGVVYAELDDTINDFEREKLITQISAIDIEWQEAQYQTSETSVGQDATGAIGWLGGVLGFTAFGIIIAAAFAAGAKSQLVLMGQLSANGAPRQLLRRVLMLQGGWTALLGALAGVVVFFITLPFLERPIEFIVGYPIETIRWSLFDIVVIVATAMATGLVAAAIPARSLSRVSVLSALAGRRPVGRVPHWMVPVGVVGFFGGLGLLILAVLAGSSFGAMVGAVIGVLAMVFGMCFISPAAIDLAGRFGGPLPLAARMSLRGLRRARARSAAVVTAIAVTAGVASIVVALGEIAINDNSYGPYLADNVAVVYDDNQPTITADGQPVDMYDDGGVMRGGSNSLVGTDIELEWASTPNFAIDASATLAELLPDASIMEMRVARAPAGTYEVGSAIDPYALGSFPDTTIEIGNDAYFATRATTDPVEPALRLALQESGVVIVDSCGEGDGYYLDFFNIESLGLLDLSMVPVVESHSENSCMTELLITESYARQNGLEVVTAGFVAVTPSPLTDLQRQAIDDHSEQNYAPDNNFLEPGEQASTEPESVEASDEIFDPWIDFERPYDTTTDRALLYSAAIGIAFVLTLLVVGIGLALNAGEGRRDRAVLSVVGAKPSTLRRMTAADAWAMSIVGVSLGVPSALFGLWALTSATSPDVDPFVTGAPWIFVVVQFTVLPVVVAGFAYVASLFARKVTFSDHLRPG